MAFGIAPPMPSPVSTPERVSASTDCAVAVSSEPTPKISAQAMSTGLRPMRSASGPLISAPIIMPTRPAGDHRAEHAARDLQRRRQRRRDVAHRLRVESVDEHDEPAHRGDQPGSG